MKKILCAVALGFVLSSVSFLFAQETENTGTGESEFYYVNTPIEKIYVYRAGYVVIYQKSVTERARVYIPTEWFGPSGKADMITMGPGKAWPYMTLYYKSGEFSHARLYVRRERAHETWGVVPLTANLDEYFESVEELRLEY